MVLLYGTIQIVPVNGTFDGILYKWDKHLILEIKTAAHCWKINNANPTVTTPLKIMTVSLM
jgi:hypothetical protein